MSRRTASPLGWIPAVLVAAFALIAPIESPRLFAARGRHRKGRKYRQWGIGVVLTAVATTLTLLAATSAGTAGGFVARITNSADSAGTAAYFHCTDAEASEKSTALFQYHLNEAAGSTTAIDASGNNNNGTGNGTYQGVMTTSTASPMACPRDGGSAWVLDGSSSYLSTPINQTNPTTFTLVVWFKTTVASGRLIGFGSAQTGVSSSYDRHIYFKTTGQLAFGICPCNSSTAPVITSPSSYTDGSWHQVIATLAPAGAAGAGMALYVDGTLVAADPSSTVAQNANGYWRIGYDRISNWPGAGANGYFTGSMRYAAVYTSCFTPAQVQRQWAAGQ